MKKTNRPIVPASHVKKEDRLLRKIFILGSPNVGKSVLFNNLTGRYMTVANYPGTTVEVARGRASWSEYAFEIIDTPGVYSFSPITEEESVTRNLLFKEKPFLVLQTVDAKNLQRMLPLTLQLIEASIPVILILNMMDESRALGLQIDSRRLAKELEIPVIEAVSVTGEGMPELRAAIVDVCENKVNPSNKKMHYEGTIGDSIETALNQIASLLQADYTISKRSISLFALKEDPVISRLIQKNEPEPWKKISEIVEYTKSGYPHPLEYEIALHLNREAISISNRTFNRTFGAQGNRIQKWLDYLAIHPLTGFPILLAILYFGLYQFVGVFGAGVVVGFLEETIFETYINPLFIRVFTFLIPWTVLSDLFVGPYGLLTLGFRYAVALILPVVTFYFAVFAVIEDSGYLPRLALLLDRMFKKIGLSGRAVIPMVLGFGCDTMATMVTRTLPTQRERIISTLLLALAVPCSAQLGVILALLSGHPLALGIWALVVSAIFLLVGYLSSQVLPGDRPSFYMELPPLRLPKIEHVVTKTYVRVKWYFKEVLPLFLIASAIIWLGQLTGVFDWIIRMLSGPVRLIGLPKEAASIFLMGFFRRDYGAAGLYDLAHQGMLNGTQILVACVALTLFLPCIAQFLMNMKERGWKTGLVISILILVASFVVAFFLNMVLMKSGISL